MKFRILVGLIAVTLAAGPVFAAMYVIPAVGRTPGADGSNWQTEVTIHNASNHVVDINARLFEGTKEIGVAGWGIAPHTTRSEINVLGSSFNFIGGGGLTLEVGSEPALRALAVTARVYNSAAAAGGEYGQDITVYNADDALGPADIGTILGPSYVGGTRFNFGIFALEASTVKWQLVRSSGAVAAQREVSYLAREQRQYNYGIETFFGASRLNGDVVYARVQSGKVFTYGSIVSASGDPTWVPGTRTRDNTHIMFLGVDIDENGVIDVHDANMDGVLDKPLVIKTSLYPYYLRMVVDDDTIFGLTYEVVSAPSLTKVLDDQGTLVISTHGGLVGKSGEIVVKVTSYETFVLFKIPVTFF